LLGLVQIEIMNMIV